MAKVKQLFSRFWKALKSDRKTQIVTGVVVLLLVIGGGAAYHHHQTNITGDWYHLNAVPNEKITFTKDSYTTNQTGGSAVLDKNSGAVSINTKDHQMYIDGRLVRYKYIPKQQKLILYNVGNLGSSSMDDSANNEIGMNPDFNYVTLVRKDSKLYKQYLKR